MSMNSSSAMYWSLVANQVESIRHRMNLMIILMDVYTERRFGILLLEAVDDFAIEAGLIRLGLTVSEDNLWAIELYHKFGFNN